ncbi:hypothetical protein M3Y99_01765200 [Aphelenchoides fujianensis]|nr:hypothetical protein M3Y99_01765200 [Aphelenchoides fujianensis]
MCPFSFGLLLLVCLNAVRSSPWSEADESRRIAQIKAEESRVFEMQMKGQNPFVAGGAYGSEESWGLNAPGSPVHRVPIESRAAELRSAPPPETAILEKRTKNWCFHCASPWHSIGADGQRAVQNLLEIRRARFPAAAFIRSDCSSPKNISALPKQECLYSHCETLVLTDHNSGWFSHPLLTIRGCAENLGAMDERELEKRGDNTCKKLHQSVDIQECICKGRKYCYAGSKRNFGYEEDDEATTL